MERLTRLLGPVVKRTGRLRAQSPRRRAESILRRQLVVAYLEANSVCGRCWAQPSTQVHERQKRSRNPQAWLTPGLFAALCDACHRWTEAEPAQATADGWLLPSWWRPGDPCPELRSARFWS